MKHAVQLCEVSKQFGGESALADCSLTVEPGEFVTLLGASGCGKTTTVRIIAGYLAQTSGNVFIDEREVSNLPPQKRAVGMVFQDYALFPHLNVRENIAFGLKVRRWSRSRITARVDELLEMTGLTDAAVRKPKQLSGGMQQRVAVARALAFEPQLMLMDEPLAALDVKLRETMQGELIRLQREVGVTTLYVTHDQQEAMSMSDRIVVMDRGTVQQIGTPQEIYAAPASRFVADFVGTSNLLEGVVEEATRAGLTLRIGAATIQAPSASLAPGTVATLVVRPEALQIGKVAPETPGPNQFTGIVELITFMGSWNRLTLSVSEFEQRLIAQVPTDPHWQRGDAAHISWERGAAVLLTDAARPGVSTATGDVISGLRGNEPQTELGRTGPVDADSGHHVNA